MSYCIEDSIKNELWLLRISRSIGTDVGEETTYLAMKDWVMACEDTNLAVQVVDNAMVSPISVYKLSRALQIFTNDYSLVRQRIKSDAKPDDKPAVVRKVKAKAKRAKRITGDGPRPETP